MYNYVVVLPAQQTINLKCGKILKQGTSNQDSVVPVLTNPQCKN